MRNNFIDLEMKLFVQFGQLVIPFGFNQVISLLIYLIQVFEILFRKAANRVASPSNSARIMAICSNS